LYGTAKDLASFEVPSGWSIATPGTVFGCHENGPLRYDTAVNRVLYRLGEGKTAYMTHAERCWTPMFDVFRGVCRFLNHDIKWRELLCHMRQGKLQMSTLLHDIHVHVTDLTVRDETGCSLSHDVPRISYAKSERIQYWAWKYWRLLVETTGRELI